jgi:nondiscriminating aspartyl-tRNA synthetase
MERVWSVDLPWHVGEHVSVAGWLYRLRRLSAVAFLIVRDGQGLAQVVLEPEQADRVAAWQPESVVRVLGTVVANAQAPRGVEVRAERVQLVSEAVAPPPFELHRPHIPAQLPTILDHASVALRHPRQRAIFRLSAAAVAGFRATLTAERFVEIHTPKLVAAATESGANVFPVDYFGRTAYLAQSPQFYKQTMVGAFERVFEVGPVFRAEPHDTTRHINEYVSLDMEMGFIEDHFTVMAVLRDVMAGIMVELRERCAAELTLLGARLPEVPAVIPHIHFSEAQELILALHGVDVRGEPDLSPQDERWLGEWAQTEHGSDFLYVTGYPMSKRPFYVYPDPARPEYSNSFDLIFRGTELVTGGQRLHRYADYLAALEAHKLPIEPFVEYLETFRYGMPPEGGFAIGLERLLMQLLDLPNVKLAALFPRDLTRLTP